VSFDLPLRLERGDHAVFGVLGTVEPSDPEARRQPSWMVTDLHVR
jgi:hypothetical protein